MHKNTVTTIEQIIKNIVLSYYSDFQSNSTFWMENLKESLKELLIQREEKCGPILTRNFLHEVDTTIVAIELVLFHWNRSINLTPELSVLNSLIDTVEIFENCRKNYENYKSNIQGQPTVK